MTSLIKLSKQIPRTKSCYLASVPQVAHAFRCFASHTNLPKSSVSNPPTEDSRITPFSDKKLSRPWYRGENRVDVGREILGALAVRFTYYYVFEYDQIEGPSIHDVLRAKNGSIGWDFVRYKRDGYQTYPWDTYSRFWAKKGDPVYG
jgi:hypothetical protein